MAGDEFYMHRCFDLAARGAGVVSPNPMVGAVLVHNNRIIGEGWHAAFGQAHAEVNCIAEAVANGFADLLVESTLFVNLEPCAHFGKTPPCADLLVSKKIKRVVISNRDPFKQVDGKGIEKLKAAGIEVLVGIEEKEGAALNRRFFCYHTLHRPYVILKWAQTEEGVMGVAGSRLRITDAATNRLVHQWRGEEDAIMIGVNTAIADDPLLTNRLGTGGSPIRLLMDPQLRAGTKLRMFREPGKTIVYNYLKEGNEGAADRRSGLEATEFVKISNDKSSVSQVLSSLFQKNIQSLLVEGGTKLLQSFLDENLWDEIRVIRGSAEVPETKAKIFAPVADRNKLHQERELGTDHIFYYFNSTGTMP